MPLSEPGNEKSIFLEALQKGGEERRAFLEAACGDNPALRAEVEALLAANDRSGDLLDVTAPGPLSPTLVGPQNVPEPGTTIGPYKLLQQIGEGGMGTVYMAEQSQPVQRKVALKIIKPGMDTRQVVARFEAERQALALMDHPHIARVLDAGTTDNGLPYFVMELVKGVPLTKYCDDHRLTPRQRLELFIPVCQAVQHAHQKGIIHRDLKPSNVLVALYDGRPVPKVIDFGVAKATGQKLTDRTMYTEFGAIVGTLEYMSPEQAELNQLDIDTRSDIYSLGVLLYELLTGTTPFEKKRLKDAALLEVLRIIREDEPPKPSTRLSTDDELPGISANRGLEPRKLSELVRGDLDWIVMKALDKDRNRRYETAAGLALDLQRFLTDEPIAARPPTTWYRFRKLARRNRAAFLGAVAVALALLVGTGVSVWQALRAKTAELDARRQEREAREQRRLAVASQHQTERQRDQLATLNETLRRSSYVAEMNLAHHAWNEDNLIRAQELLNAHRPRAGETDLRGFEWHYLNRLLHRDMWTAAAHQGPALSVVHAPGGKRIFSAGSTASAPAMNDSLDTPGEVKLWDAVTGREIPLTLEGSTGVRRIALSPDGTTLAAACLKHGIKLWNLTSGEMSVVESPEREVVLWVTFSPDGRQLASRSLTDESDPYTDSHVLTVWNLADRQPIVRIRKLPMIMSSPSFSPDGKYLAVTLSLLGIARVYEVSTGSEVFSFVYQGGLVASAVFTPDGRRLAACGDQGIQVWDVETREQMHTWKTGFSSSVCLAFDTTGRQLAIGSLGGGVQLWDAETGNNLADFKGHSGQITHVEFSPDGRRLISCGSDGTIRAWDVTKRLGSSAINSTETQFSLMDLSPDGQRLITQSRSDKSIQLWNVPTGEPCGEKLVLQNLTQSADWSADGSRLIIPDGQQRLLVFDAATGRQLHTLDCDLGSSATVALSPEGHACAHSAPNATIVLRDLETGAKQRAISGLEELIHNLAFSRDGKLLAGTDVNGWVRIWNLATGRELSAAKIEGMYFYRIRFSHDGKRLAVAGNRSRHLNGVIYVLDTVAGSTPLEFKGHTFNVTDVAFSPDGNRLASTSADGTTRLWDLTTAQEVLTIRSSAQFTCSVRFLSNGQQLLDAATDRSVRLWDATPIAE